MVARNEATVFPTRLLRDIFSLECEAADAAAAASWSDEAAADAHEIVILRLELLPHRL